MPQPDSPEFEKAFGIQAVLSIPTQDQIEFPHSSSRQRFSERYDRPSDEIPAMKLLKFN